ncbi:unnamed protein product [Rhizophagus irregularis]|nr:unnamed protein product [Rhizophagus irregularis]
MKPMYTKEGPFQTSEAEKEAHRPRVREIIEEIAQYFNPEYRIRKVGRSRGIKPRRNQDAGKDESPESESKEGRPIESRLRRAVNSSS